MTNPLGNIISYILRDKLPLCGTKKSKSQPILQQKTLILYHSDHFKSVFNLLGHHSPPRIDHNVHLISPRSCHIYLSRHSFFFFFFLQGNRFNVRLASRPLRLQQFLSDTQVVRRRGRDVKFSAEEHDWMSPVTF